MKCEYCGVNITEGFLCAKHRAKVDAGECNCDEFSPTCTYCQIREKEEHERTQAELSRLRAVNAEKDAEIARLRETLREIRDNYDCDPDAHKHGTRCQCCIADEALSEQNPPEVEK